MPKTTYTRKSLIEALQRFAATEKRRIGMGRFIRWAGTSMLVIRRFFPGGYDELLTAAGLEGRYARKLKVSEEMMMEEVDRLAHELKRTPTGDDVEQVGRIRPLTFARRIGCWSRVLAKYEAWKKKRGAEETEQKTKKKPGPAPVWNGGRTDGRWAGGRSGVVGAPMGFRGLVHAPVNELGVIHLFGLLGPELGIAVEHIGPNFPDCRAIRKEQGAGGRWRRIAIEFEFRSSSFKRHGHDPAKCHLIVCWEHDWKDCPLPVIELKEELEKARRRDAA